MIFQIFIIILLFIILFIVFYILYTIFNKNKRRCPLRFRKVGDQCVYPCPDGWEERLDKNNNGVCYSPCKKELNITLEKEYINDDGFCKYTGCLDDEIKIDNKCYKKCKNNKKIMKLDSGSVICTLPCPDYYNRDGRYCNKTGSIKKYEILTKTPCTEDALKNGYKYINNIGCVKCPNEYSDFVPNLNTEYACRLGTFDAKSEDAKYMRDYISYIKREKIVSPHVESIEK
jgi:hypothetical protein